MPLGHDFNHLPQVIATVGLNEAPLAKDVAEYMEGVATRKAPVLTGLLKFSIHTERAGRSTYQVVADTKNASGGTARAYAHYVEFGTRYAHAQPFMIPAYVAGLVMVPTIGDFTFGHKVELAAETGSVVV